MGPTERLARSCSAHPRRTLAAWGAAVVLGLAAAATLLGLTSEFGVNGRPESKRADELVAQHFPRDRAAAASDVVVVYSPRLTADEPAFRRFVAGLGLHGPALPSADRHAVRIPLVLPGNSAVPPLVARVDRANGTDGFQVGITGEHVTNHDFDDLSQTDLEKGELEFGLPAALLILLLVFGTVVAALVPLLMALVSIAVAIGIVALLSQAFTLSIFVVNMLTGMGLALGVDYSLFVVSRYREERGRGREPADAVAAAGRTASRAVLFSGSAFVVALFGMLFVRTTIMRSLAAGAIVVGIVSVAAALTLLPALLGLLGDRVNRWRVPVVGRGTVGGADPEGRFWRAVVARVLRRPALSLALAAVPMLALAVPVLGLHIGASGVTTLPDRLPSKQGFLLLQREFPDQEVNPAVVAVANVPGARAALGRARAELARDPRFGPGEVVVSPDGTTALLTAPVRGDPVGKAAIAGVRDLRARVLPAAFAGVEARPLVGGKTADNVDYFDAVSSPAPYVFAFVLGLTLVLLTIVFRSVAVAGIAIVLNLLSVGAAYGLLVLVFLHGWGTGILGFQHVTAIDAWVPLFLFSVLFGLSMDYQVFLLSRVRERYDASGATRDAVSHGVASTARIITGAALIIVAVFAGFARGELVMFQQMGFGIAVALLLDATVIRSVVLPSAMALLGDATWYLPRWLGWLPRVRIEGEGPAEAPRLEPG